ncbi:MAG: IclR family transcriptional regulator [Desulfuromonadaceae bacterium]
MKIKREKTDYTILAVSHALDLLEQFNGIHDEIGLTELSKRLKLNKNNVFRLLATLEGREYIEQNRITANYRLGIKTLEMGQTFIRQGRLKSRARPVLEDTANFCNETTLLAILKQDTVFYLDAVETTHVVRVAPRVGSWLPAYCTTAGMVQLAFLPENELEIILTALVSSGITASTSIDRDTFQNHLGEIARNGYALDRDDFEVGLRGIAAPVCDFSGRNVGSVSLVGPSLRFSDRRLEYELIPLCLQAAADISTRLGYSP